MFRKVVLAAAPAFAVMAAVSVYGWSKLPAGARVATHFDAAGHPNGYMGRTAALVMLPVMAVLLTLLLGVLPAIDPRGKNLARSPKFVTAAVVGVDGLVALVHTALVLRATHHHVDVVRLAIIGTGVLLMILGNYQGKIRSNFFMGARTPWTLSSERSWNTTNRLGGRLLFAVGALTVVTALAASMQTAIAVLLAGTLIVAAITVAYSFVKWRSDPAKAPAPIAAGPGDE